MLRVCAYVLFLFLLVAESGIEFGSNWNVMVDVDDSLQHAAASGWCGGSFVAAVPIVTYQVYNGMH